MTVTLTVDDTLRIMAEVVAEFGPDHVYEPPPDDMGEYAGTCRYVWLGCPSCLIGHTLVRAGVPTFIVAKYEGTAARTVLRWLRVEGEIDCDDLVIEMLEAAQAIQDGRRAGAPQSWGAALAAARNVAEGRPA